MAAVQLVRFGANPPPIETGKPGNIIAGDPATRLQNYFTDGTGQFFSGIWESSPGKWRVSYSESEFCAIISGCAILVGADGKAEEFK
ncbi:MAG: cupin domain-containing protein, partial [Dongiaceae bacterium]